MKFFVIVSDGDRLLYTQQFPSEGAAEEHARWAHYVGRQVRILYVAP